MRERHEVDLYDMREPLPVRCNQACVFLVPARMAGVLRQPHRIVIKLDTAKPARPQANTQTHI